MATYLLTIKTRPGQLLGLTTSVSLEQAVRFVEHLRATRERVCFSIAQGDVVVFQGTGAADDAARAAGVLKQAAAA